MVALFRPHRIAGAALYAPDYGGLVFTVSAAGLPSTLAFGAATFTAVAEFSIAGSGLASSLAFGSATFLPITTFSIAATGRPSTAAFGVARFIPEGSAVNVSDARRLIVPAQSRLFVVPSQDRRIIAPAT